MNSVQLYTYSIQDVLPSSLSLSTAGYTFSKANGLYSCSPLGDSHLHSTGVPSSSVVAKISIVSDNFFPETLMLFSLARTPSNSFSP